jgi:alkaline phosphatase D
MRGGQGGVVKQSTVGKLARRTFVAGALAGMGGVALAPRRAFASAHRLADYPFTLGVASGYPQPDGVVLWTRLAPAPLAPGGGIAADAVVLVNWEVAADERLRNVVAAGTMHATAQWGHSVHVEVSGLEPGREYWYRFRTADHASSTGRTRTAPAPAAPVDRLRVAVASCQQYEHGYYAAYRHMVADDPDLILHLGDYIYELSWGTNLVRRHVSPECYTLDDYRARYALYRGDPDLQAAHASCPWLVTWDDHEVDNDYAAAVSEEDDPPELFLARRAAAYQAYYEHMPLPGRGIPFGPHLRLHAARMFGDLAQIVVLDGRQYRSPLACPVPGKRGGRATICAEIDRADRTMLGTAQEEWLQARLKQDSVGWNLLAQQTVMTRVDDQPGPGERFWTDAWNGYPAARARLLRSLVEHRTGNPVVLSGDIHAFAAANLSVDAADPGAPVVASEFVTTSITSQGVADKLAGQVLSENPNILFGSAEYRGYLRLDVTRAQLRADFVAMVDATRRDSGRRVLASFVVESGRPGPERA